jgi:hypothetical protein
MTRAMLSVLPEFILAMFTAGLLCCLFGLAIEARKDSMQSAKLNHAISAPRL